MQGEDKESPVSAPTCTITGMDHPRVAGARERWLATVVKAYDPPYGVSTSVYDYIRVNLADWIETAIEIRRSLIGRFSGSRMAADT